MGGKGRSSQRRRNPGITQQTRSPQNESSQKKSQETAHPIEHPQNRKTEVIFQKTEVLQGPEISQRKGEYPKRKRSNPEEVTPEMGQSQGCLPKRRNRWLGADLQIGTLRGKENTHQKERNPLDGVILGIKTFLDGENTLRIESTT